MEAEDRAPFPNAWNAGPAGPAGPGGKGNGKGKGKGGKGGKGGQGKGKGGKGKGNGKKGNEELSEDRENALRSALEALAQGTEPDATPRVGDVVELRILGGDRAELHGRRGRVVGAVQPGATKSLHSGAYTLRLDEVDGREREVTAPASDLRVVEASMPLPEASMSFPKSLSGLERKAVHAAAEALGLVSQSFGQGPERYITVFRAAAVTAATAAAPATAATPTHTDGIDGTETERIGDELVESSGVELDEVSREQLLHSLAVPEDWQVFADRCELCRGPLNSPSSLGGPNSVAADMAGQIRQLAEANWANGRANGRANAELRVVSLARGLAWGLCKRMLR